MHHMATSSEDISSSNTGTAHTNHPNTSPPHHRDDAAALGRARPARGLCCGRRGMVWGDKRTLLVLLTRIRGQGRRCKRGCTGLGLAEAATPRPLRVAATAPLARAHAHAHAHAHHSRLPLFSLPLTRSTRRGSRRPPARCSVMRARVGRAAGQQAAGREDEDGMGRAAPASRESCARASLPPTAAL